MTMLFPDEVRSAFEGVIYPGDSSLTACPCEECKHLASALYGKSWNVITIADVVGVSSVDETLSALSSSGFHFYLPGLMLLAADDDNDTLRHSITARFTAHNGESSDTVRTRERVVHLLTMPQRHTVRHFFEWLRGFETHCPHVIDSAIDNLVHGRIRPYSTAAVAEWVEAYVNKLAPGGDRTSPPRSSPLLRGGI